MYKQIWEKYLPIVRILMKKTTSGPQTLDLNKLDFDAAGIAKSSFKFKIEFLNGRISNVIHDSPIAVELAHQLLDNDETNKILNERNIVISVSPRYQMTIKTNKD